MEQDGISVRQRLVLLWTGLLSPAIRFLPGAGARTAGEAGWLSTLAALPAVLALSWGLFRLLRAAPEGEGLFSVFRQVLGGALSRVLGAVYLLWGLFLLSLNTRQCAQRFLSTEYRNGPIFLYIAVLLGMVLWLARGKVAAFARAGEIFYLILTVTLVVVLALAAFQVEAENLLPVWTEDVPGALHAGVSAAAVLGYGVYGAFLAGGVRVEGDRKRVLVWPAVFCLLLSALQLMVVGSFGPALVGRMEQPFFMMVKGIGVQGVFQRFESVVIALWALSDLAFLGILATACCALAKDVLGLREGQKAAWPVAALALVGSVFLFPNAFMLAQVAEKIVVAGNLILGYGAVAVVFFLAKCRRKI